MPKDDCGCRCLDDPGAAATAVRPSDRPQTLGEEIANAISHGAG
jgi:hypothetical protein